MSSRVRLSLAVHSVALRGAGVVVVAVGMGLLAVGGVTRGAAVALVGGMLLVAGVALWRSRSVLVWRPAGSALAQVERTLRLMGVRYVREGQTLTVAATGTRVRARGLGRYAILSFGFAHGGAASERERFLRATIVKYQRFHPEREQGQGQA